MAKAKAVTAQWDIIEFKVHQSVGDKLNLSNSIKAMVDDAGLKLVSLNRKDRKAFRIDTIADRPVLGRAPTLKSRLLKSLSDPKKAEQLEALLDKLNDQ